MPSLSSDGYQVWLKLRKQTMVIFVIQSLLIGMDASMTYLTLYMYLKEMIKSDKPLVYYSIIFVLYYLPPFTLSIIIGHFIDRSSNIRLATFTINTW